MSAVKHFGFDDEGNEIGLPKELPRPTRAVDPYDHTAPQPALWGSVWAPNEDGTKKPTADVKTVIITEKR